MTPNERAYELKEELQELFYKLQQHHEQIEDILDEYKQGVSLH